MNKDSPIIFFIILIVILALGVLGVIYLQGIVPDPVKEGATKSDSEKATIRCEEVVKAALRNAAKSKLTRPTDQRPWTKPFSGYWKCGWPKCLWYYC